MTFEAFYTYVLSKPAAAETFPFGPETLVMKVGGKMFALVGLEAQPVFCNLKCDPERSMELRAEFDGVKPGYHMNKKHWNTVDLSSDVPAPLIRELVDHSYDLVVASLSKAAREGLAAS